MTEHRFETNGPVQLYVEVGRGNVRIDAVDTSETLVSVSGRDADDVVVTQDGSQISVIAPRQRTGFLGRESDLDVSVSLPSHSDLMVKTGSADISVDGPVGSCQFKTGSGDIRVDTLEGPALIESGSGDVAVDVSHADLRIKSGSGDIEMGRTGAELSVSTGSGDVHLGATFAPAAVKTGSGDLRVDEAGDDVSLASGSGDLLVALARRGRLTMTGASGDVRIGIPHGIPVWTDIFTLTGEISSDLVGAGEPTEGADHLEVRAKTASGDITLHQL